MNLLIKDMVKQGAEVKKIKTRIFGGGNVLNKKNSFASLNVASIESFLDQLKIPVVAKDVGDGCGRKITFCTSTLKIYVKKFGANWSCNCPAEKNLIYV